MSESPIDLIKELPEEKLDELLDAISEDDLDDFHKQQLAIFARNNDNPEGFEAFYDVMMRKPMPNHVREWIEKLYEAHAQGLRGVIIRAMRGGTKSTVEYLFVLFRTGHRPQGSSMIVRIKDKAGYKVSARMARVVEFSKDFQLVFPDIVPDKPAGWGASGYEVMSKKWWFKRHVATDGTVRKGKMLSEKPDPIDPEKHIYTDISYDEWQDLREEDGSDSPSFLGVGIGSSAIIGKHPTNCLMMDDVHNRDNTESFKELAAVKERYAADIVPTIVPGKTWMFWACTPWVENDVYNMAEASGQYIAIHTPALRKLTGEEMIEYEKGKEFPVFRGDPVVLTWPEVIDIPFLESVFSEIGEKEFARMYWLNLQMAKGINLKKEWLTEFAIDHVKPDWGVVMGIDYASTPDNLRKGQERDYASLAIGRIIPSGGIVLMDGIFTHLSQQAFLDEVVSLAASYPTLMAIGVESQGKGEEFLEIMRYTTNLPLIQYPASRKKGTRFEQEMAPVFQNRRAYVSEVITPFIREFRNEWISWDGTETSGYDDCLDAVYYMLRTGISHLMPAPQSDGLNVTNPLYGRRRKAKSPASYWLGENNG